MVSINSLKCGRRIIDNTHSRGNYVQLACAERTHTVCTLHTHLLENFARLTDDLLLMLRAFSSFFLFLPFFFFWFYCRRLKMSSECWAVKTAACLSFLFSCFFQRGRPLQKQQKNTKKRGRQKKKILILDQRVMFVNETYPVPLCTTMLICSTKRPRRRPGFLFALRAFSFLHIRVRSLEETRPGVACTRRRIYCSSGLAISDSTAGEELKEDTSSRLSSMTQQGLGSAQVQDQSHTGHK